MNEKEERQVSSFLDQTSTFDVDTVMKKAGQHNQPEKMVSAKKLLAKRSKKTSSRPKKVELNS
jgi:hypothetical protein